MRSSTRGLVRVALLAGLLTGCSGAATGDDAKPSTSTAPQTAEALATSGGTIGAAASPCELPVTFDIAEGWKAEAVDTGGDAAEELFDAIARQGPVALVCEIDAKPAGNIGFLRVWTGDPGDDDARAVLEAFMADEDGTSDKRYRTFETEAGVPGVEVEYLHTVELLDEAKEESAFAVATPDGPVVVHLGGLDTEEHKQMLPAYELAKQTLSAPEHS
ncbi:lipoprotein [Streptomyces sp. NPDC002845]